MVKHPPLHKEAVVVLPRIISHTAHVFLIHFAVPLAKNFQTKTFIFHFAIKITI